MALRNFSVCRTSVYYREPQGCRPGKRRPRAQLLSLLLKRLKIAKPKGAALHLFRHSHGSRLLASGMELPAVFERLSHSSIMVTATVYSHRLTERDKEAVRVDGRCDH